MKFSLGGVGSRDVVIPAGTRVSPDGELMFATDNECTIAIGRAFAVDSIGPHVVACTIGKAADSGIDCANRNNFV